MNMAEPAAPYLDALRALPFVRKATLTVAPQRRAGRAAGAILELVTPRGRQRWRVEETGSHLTHALVGDLVTRTAARELVSPMLFAPYVSPPMGARLAEHGIAFVDRAGNCHLDLGGRYVAHVEGRRLRQAVAPGGLRAAGFRAVFALLVEPGLLNRPLRELAASAGVSLGTTANVLRRLEQDRVVVTTRSKRHLVRRDDLVERWTAGYAETLRPQLLAGRFETGEKDPQALERRVEAALGADAAWAWGGAAAAFRLTRHYRSDETVLHAASVAPDLPRRIGAIPHPGGRLTLLGVPGPLAFHGHAPRTVHPLLVYTELVLTGSERARGAAAEVRERFLVSD